MFQRRRRTSSNDLPILPTRPIRPPKIGCVIRCAPAINAESSHRRKTFPKMETETKSRYIRWQFHRVVPLFIVVMLFLIRHGVSTFSFDVLFRRLITILWHNFARRSVFDLMLQNWISNRHSIPTFCFFCYNIQSRPFQRFI